MGLAAPALQTSEEQYLRSILAREEVLTGPPSPAFGAIQAIQPCIDTWSNGFVASVQPSGSFAKGTANRSGTDLDLFISIRADVPNTLEQIHDTLVNQLIVRGFTPKRQNVSIGIQLNGISVDLVPGRQHIGSTGDHSIFHRRTTSWKKTNIAKHVAYVRAAGVADEIRLIKLWRRQQSIDFPSFYLELAVIEALRGSYIRSLPDRVITVLQYLADGFRAARMVDPANSNNVISDELTIAEKKRIEDAAALVLTKRWMDFVR